tara:strand:+ start:632 stop:1150 length:519 start_codon:yes stop_codon:yes gene_type:complete
MEELYHTRTKAYNILDKIIQDEYISRNVEKGIYNYTIWKSKERRQRCMWDNIHFLNMYVNKVRQIVTNISPNTYTDKTQTLKRLKEKQFLPHEIAFMTCYEIFPEHWESIIAEKKKKDAMMCEIDFGQATNQFRCMKCKGNKTTYYTMQTRSADEGETIFITCLNCGKRWRK